MNETELSEIEARANAATKGPWKTSITEAKTLAQAILKLTEYLLGNPGTDVHGVWCPNHPMSNVGSDTDRPTRVMACHTGNGTNSPNNAVFIANAREDVPKLIAEVRRLRSLVKDAQCEHKFTADSDCLFCGAPDLKKHFKECPAFTPDGDLK